MSGLHADLYDCCRGWRHVLCVDSSCERDDCQWSGNHECYGDLWRCVLYRNIIGCSGEHVRSEHSTYVELDEITICGEHYGKFYKPVWRRTVHL